MKTCRSVILTKHRKDEALGGKNGEVEKNENKGDYENDEAEMMWRKWIRWRRKRKKKVGGKYKENREKNNKKKRREKQKRQRKRKINKIKVEKKKLKKNVVCTAWPPNISLKEKKQLLTFLKSDIEISWWILKFKNQNELKTI